MYVASNEKVYSHFIKSSGYSSLKLSMVNDKNNALIHNNQIVNQESFFLE